jgi:hypothetical protein
LSDIDRAIEMVKVFTGYSQAKIENMRANKFNSICKRINHSFDKWNSGLENGKPKKLILVNGKFYRLNYDIKQMVASQYVEAVTFAQNPIKELHKILATMAVPVRWSWGNWVEYPYKPEEHEKIAEQMLDAEYDDVYHALLFFWAVFDKSISSMDTSGKVTEGLTAARLVKLSERSGDGFIKPKWLRTLKELN